MFEQNCNVTELTQITWKAVLFAVFIEHGQRRIVNLILWLLGSTLVSFLTTAVAVMLICAFQSLKSAGRCPTSSLSPTSSLKGITARPPSSPISSQMKNEFF